MKKLLCPQCKIQRFRVLNAAGEAVVVTVTEDYEIIPIREGQSLEDFDLDVLYCLGCSWKGSPKRLGSHKH
jgi:hypothetical protein